jgi:hypothetical protein
MVGKIVKPSRDPHSGYVTNKLTFDQMYVISKNNPEVEYYTSGNQTPFTVSASVTTRGKHKGEPVLIFCSDASERARSYRCCWGHITNCNRTYIDCYTSVLFEVLDKCIQTNMAERSV